jgi:hypothetical protein
MATKAQRGNGRVTRQYRSLVARLSVVALVVSITGAGLAAHGGGSASASANAAGGYKLAPAMMGGGASQPGANPNATLTTLLSLKDARSPRGTDPGRHHVQRLVRLVRARLVVLLGTMPVSPWQGYSPARVPGVLRALPRSPGTR